MVEIFKTQPHLVPKVWGGSKLATVFDKVLPTDEAYGESWEVADLPEGQSGVASGTYEGETLGALVDLLGDRLVGTASPDGRFPLLVKLLDATQDLSVQVHPGPADVEKLEGADSKDECWVILAVDDGGSILHGLNEAVAEDVFLDRVATGTVTNLLRRVEVHPGDVFRVPPGTIHAICAGVSLLEIQQPSDTTYRVYDYDRPGRDGGMRQLHLQEAMAVANLVPSLPEERGLGQSTGPMLTGARVLANVDAYRVERIEPEDAIDWAVSSHTPQVVHVLRGNLYLNDVPMAPSETAIVPAEVGRVWLSEPENCEIVVAGMGGPALLAP